MEDLFSILAVQTAIPFGYLIFALIWLVSSLWALERVIRLCWSRRFGSITLYVASGLLLLNAATFYANIMFDKHLDFNPDFDEAAIVGTWRDGKSELSLLEDGTAILNLSEAHGYRLDVESGEGSWQRVYDFHIKISDAKKRPGSRIGLLRVIRYNETYRLIIDDFDDPDMWDGHLGFKRVNSAKD